MKRVAFYTLGCKVNQYETDAMTELFKKAGYETAGFNEPAEIYIVNTCTVTQIADKKSRQMLHRARRQNPGALVVAVGCYVEEAADTLRSDPMIDLAVGNHNKAEIVSLCEKALDKKRNAGEALSEKEEQTSVSIQDPHRIYEPLAITEQSEHTRVYIKIQDGCDQFCSYCIIPFARGRVRSRRPEEIITEVTHFMQEGCREVVLTGIHISSYGLDFDNTVYNNRPENEHLINLIEMLCSRIPSDGRIRLGSLEPRIVTEDFAKRLAALPQVCPQFHLSMQSGCDATLARMNRRYSSADYRSGCAALRRFFDDPAITTDVIVGFPGETEEEFEASIAFCAEMAFARMHVFKYSVRPGTRAAGLPDQVPETVKNLRSERMLKLERQMRRDYELRQAGTLLKVIAETKQTLKQGVYWTGHTENYIPTAIPDREEYRIAAGDLIQVRMTGPHVKDYMIAVPIL